MKHVFISCIFVFVSIIANAQNLPGTLTTKFGGRLYCNGVLVNPEFAQSFMTTNQFEAYKACEEKAQSIKNNLMTALYIEGGSIAAALIGGLTSQKVILATAYLGEVAAAGFLIYGLIQAGSNQSNMENLISNITFGTNHSASLSFGPTKNGIGLALNF